MRKKLFAVIMSVMMMVTFMPAMAFAAGETGTPGHLANVDSPWNEDYSKVTVYNADGDAQTVATTRTMEDGGLIKATPNWTAAGLQSGSTTADAYYYDMSSVTLDYKLGEQVRFSKLVSLFGSWDATNKKFNDIEVSGSAGSIGFAFVAPEYCINKGVEKSSYTLAGAVVTIKAPAYDMAKKYENQPLSVSTKVVTGKDISTGKTLKLDGSQTKPFRTPGSVAAKNITVLAETASVNAASFKLGTETKESVSSSNYTADFTAVYYDGTEKAITMEEMPGVTVAYEKYNTETSKFETVSSLSVKDVDTYEFKAKLTKGTETRTHYINVEVKPVKINVTLKTKNGKVEVYKGTKYDLRDKVQVLNNESTASANKAAYQAAESVLKVHEADFKALFDAAYEVKQEVLSVKIAQKEGVDLKAAKEAIPQLANITLTVDTTAYILDEIEIEKNDVTACNQTKTYHVKKAKALKAKKTFKLEGDVVDFGEPIYAKKSGNSKITVAKDGTVTVKKGLKKGTYSVKIKVKAVCTGAASGYVSDTKTLKVKIKK